MVPESTPERTFSDKVRALFQTLVPFMFADVNNGSRVAPLSGFG
jgi:hypothetical protein